MSKINDGGEAFGHGQGDWHFPGLSKRQWYAGMAMQGFMSNSHITREGFGKYFGGDSLTYKKEMTEYFFSLADAMLSYEQNGSRHRGNMA